MTGKGEDVPQRKQKVGSRRSPHTGGTFFARKENPLGVKTANTDLHHQTGLKKEKSNLFGREEGEGNREPTKTRGTINARRGISSRCKKKSSGADTPAMKKQKKKE